MKNHINKEVFIRRILQNQQHNLEQIRNETINYLKKNPKWMDSHATCYQDRIVYTVLGQDFILKFGYKYLPDIKKFFVSAEYYIKESDIENDEEKLKIIDKTYYFNKNSIYTLKDKKIEQVPETLSIDPTGVILFGTLVEIIYNHISS